MPHRKYEPWCEFAHGLPFDAKWPERKWPAQRLIRAPRWCSVDLRDGNQALVNPMDVNKKIRFFRTLLLMGFKEIEIGFPSASKLDFDFTRLIIEKEEIPEDVWLMVLVQAREHLIRQTIEALKGAKNVIIHLYNSTSELQRRVVFNLPKDEIKAMAVKETKLIRLLSEQILIPSGCRVRFEYSPESFTGTEINFALEICHSVAEAWSPTKQNPIILNLPETVQNCGPHFYADQIEWMHNHLKDREKIVISVHPHNDRGTGVASAELALQAGADRVEGCLFGNGERTGNVCLVTLAVNLLHHGIDPELDLSNLPSVVEMYQDCTEMVIPDRHPWVGSLVYTAFSGSHQDAIKKGFEAMKKKQQLLSLTGEGEKTSSSSVAIWEIPYLPIDPKDLGRNYEAIVRINSQSGKGGIAFIMESDFGIQLPRGMQIEFSQCVQSWCDKTAKEVDSKKIYEIFRESFLDLKFPLDLVTYKVSSCCSPRKGSNETVSPNTCSASAKDESCLGVNKRCHTGTQGTPGSSPLITVKRQDLGKVYNDESVDDDSRIMATTDASCPMVPSNAGQNTQLSTIIHKSINGNCMNESPSSEWLVVDRPILGNGNLNMSNKSTVQYDDMMSPQSYTERVFVDARILLNGLNSIDLQGNGNGPIDAFIIALNQLNKSTTLLGHFDFEVQTYYEMAIGQSSSAEAICFIELKATTNSQHENESMAPSSQMRRWGAARHTNTTTASLHAICSAINRFENLRSGISS